MSGSLLNSYGLFRRSLARLCSAELKGAELGLTQLSLIYYLAAGEASSASELSELMQADRAAISRSLSSMSKAGLIVRRKDPADRRREILKLTPAGLERAKEAFAARKRIAEQLVKKLGSKDARELSRLLEKAAL